MKYDLLFDREPEIARGLAHEDADRMLRERPDLRGADPGAIERAGYGWRPATEGTLRDRIRTQLGIDVPDADWKHFIEAGFGADYDDAFYTRVGSL
jgi:hypothetical protein